MPLYNPSPTAYSDRQTRDAVRPTAVVENFSRITTMANISPLASGSLQCVAGAVIPAGMAINTISLYSGTTAVSVPLNQWFCLLDMSRNVLVKSVDDTTTAWAANAKKGLALASTFTPTVNTAVYVCVNVVATAVPSLTGISSAGAGSLINQSAPSLGGTSTAGLTDPASLGATAAVFTGSAASLPYVQLS